MLVQNFKALSRSALKTVTLSYRHNTTVLTIWRALQKNVKAKKTLKQISIFYCIYTVHLDASAAKRISRRNADVADEYKFFVFVKNFEIKCRRNCY